MNLPSIALLDSVSEPRAKQSRFILCQGLSSHPFGAAVARLAHNWVSGWDGGRMAGYPFGELEP